MDTIYDFSSVMNEDDEQVFFESDNPTDTEDASVDEVAFCAKSVFGVPSLFPWQRLAIANILDGVNEVTASNIEVIDGVDELESGLGGELAEKSAFVFEEDGHFRAKQIILLPTGAGKSLCFQVPALLLPTPSLVVYPLLALMSDQVRRLREVGIEPVLLRGEQSPEERATAVNRLKNFEESNVKMIIANPEILQNEEILALLEKLQISHIAIDEAHCVSEWGDSFRPSYTKLKNVIERIKPKAITAFTATASPDVLNRISEILFDGKARIVRGETDRENLRYAVKTCRVKPPALLKLVCESEKPLVIFASSRGGTERIAAFLRYTLKTNEIRFYHAGLERAEKEQCEAWFNRSDEGILVATCAWGMGVDKKNIRTVIHYEAPSTVEAYVQEAGRGGRDGLVSKAILLWSPEDELRLKKAQGTALSRAAHVIAYATAKSCRRTILLKSLGDTNASSQYSEMHNKACSGCDVCDNTALYKAEDETALLAFLKNYKKTFTQVQLVDYLKEQNRSWRPSDLNALVNILKRENKITESTSFLWKKKLRNIKA